MPDRVVTRIFCARPKRPHAIGTVTLLDGGGLEVRFQGVYLEETYRPESGVDAAGRTARCATCNRRYSVPVEQILDGSRRGAKSFALQGHSVDALWARRYQEKQTRPD